MKKYLAIFVNRRMLLMMLLGLAAGTPLPLIGGTLQAWMKQDGIDIKSIGLAVLTGTPYAYKFLWAPALDSFQPPHFLRSLGLRRGWLISTQLALIVLLVLLAFASPAQSLTTVMVLATLIAFAGASQDIVVDAYRTEYLTESERALGTSIYILGYRLALIAGGLQLILADHMPWRSVYLIMAASLLIGVAAALAAPNLTQADNTRTNFWKVARESLAEFFKRRGSLEILLFVLCYKLGDVMAAALTTPFMLDIGFSKTAIGAVAKSFGLVATIGGTLVAGAIMTRLSLKSSLWIFGTLQGVSILAFAMLAAIGNNHTVMAAAVFVENFCNGMGTAAFTTYLMALCDRRYTATQYALLTSIMAVTRYVGGAFTGYIADAIGWTAFFLVCTAAALPGLLLLLRFDRWIHSNSSGESRI